MNNNAWFKKENPFQTVIGLGGGATAFQFHTSSAASKPYLDDVFSPYVYIGDGTSSHQITNGIDLSSKGGFIWGKERGNTGSHYQFDTVRGLNKRLKTNSDSGEETDTFYSSVNSDGYTIEKTTSVNISGNTYASWSFAEQPGFFDIVSYTGDGSGTRTISHDLGSIPGMIIFKKVSGTQDWYVYHRSVNGQYGNGGANVASRLKLNSQDKEGDDSGLWNQTGPTASVFTVGPDATLNNNGDDYIAYLFAGGSSATTANSQVKLICCKDSSSATANDSGRTITATNVTASANSPGYASGTCEFAGSGANHLDVAASEDFAFGTGDFTVEMYVNADVDTIDTWYRRLYMTDGPTGNQANNFQIAIEPSTGKINVWSDSTTGSINIVGTSNISHGGWRHVAVVRINGIVTLYVDGLAENSVRWNTSVTANSGSPRPRIGSYNGSGGNFDGKISNVRVTKGQGIYRSNFTWGQNQAGIDFTTYTMPDDTAANIFGENEDQSVVCCGEYRGNGSDDGPEIQLGWKPSWLLIKNYTSNSRDWKILDDMRGLVIDDLAGTNSNGGYSDGQFNANDNSAEDPVPDVTGGFFGVELTDNGFRINASNAHYNENGETMMFVAIRGRDSLVTKLATEDNYTASQVFALDTGSGSATIPTFDSGFAVDFAMAKRTDWTTGWYIGGREAGDNSLDSSSNGAISNANWTRWDSNKGMGVSFTSNTINFMWKRCKGFDYQVYKGNGGTTYNGTYMKHSMGQAPEMMWVKNHTGYDWYCYHKYANEGTTPEQKYLLLNDTMAAGTLSNVWNDTAPTSTHFILGSNDAVNQANQYHTAMLFSSVEGISKVGHWTGNNTSQTITTGFQPKFLIIKGDNISTQWWCFDSVNGFDTALKLNSNVATSGAVSGMISAISTGFTLNGTDFNGGTQHFLYYAHA